LFLQVIEQAKGKKFWCFDSISIDNRQLN